MKRTVALAWLVTCWVGGCETGSTSTPEDRAAAARVWHERCANCHGEGGRGDGPGARILPVRPRDFTDSGWQRSVDDDRIRQVVIEGGPAVGLDLNMAANPDLRTKPEVLAALVEIIRQLPASGPPAPPPS